MNFIPPEQVMTKSSPEYFNLAGDLLKQYAQTGDNTLSSLLTQGNLNNFKSQYTDDRVRH